MTGLELIVVFNSVAIVANTVIIYINNKTLWKVMADHA